MKHILQTIYTAHYRYSGQDRVDITVKGQHPYWKHFAPTWNMVMGVKNKTMTETDYINSYIKILKTVPTHVWDKLLQMEQVTFVCFCNEQAFCHRNILVNYVLQSVGDSIKYGGWNV